MIFVGSATRNCKESATSKRLKTTGLKNCVDWQNNIGLNSRSVGTNGCLVTATWQCYSLVETRASNSLRVTTFASDYSRWSLARVTNVVEK